MHREKRGRGAQGERLHSWRASPRDEGTLRRRRRLGRTAKEPPRLEPRAAPGRQKAIDSSVVLRDATSNSVLSRCNGRLLPSCPPQQHCTPRFLSLSLCVRHAAAMHRPSSETTMMTPTARASGVRVSAARIDSHVDPGPGERGRRLKCPSAGRRSVDSSRPEPVLELFHASDHCSRRWTFTRTRRRQTTPRRQHSDPLAFCCDTCKPDPFQHTPTHAASTAGPSCGPSASPPWPPPRWRPPLPRTEVSCPECVRADASPDQ